MFWNPDAGKPFADGTLVLAKKSCFYTICSRLRISRFDYERLKNTAASPTTFPRVTAAHIPQRPTKNQPADA